MADNRLKQMVVIVIVARTPVGLTEKRIDFVLWVIVWVSDFMLMKITFIPERGFLWLHNSKLYQSVPDSFPADVRH